MQIKLKIIPDDGPVQVYETSGTEEAVYKGVIGLLMRKSTDKGLPIRVKEAVKRRIDRDFDCADDGRPLSMDEVKVKKGLLRRLFGW